MFYDFFTFGRERREFRRKQTSEREKFNEKQRMEMEEFQREAQIRQGCPSIFPFVPVFVPFLCLSHWFYFYFLLCIMISHLCQDQIELDLAEKEKEVEESEKNILNYQQTIRVSFFNKDLIWLISLWLMLEECNLWLSTPGANSSTGTLGHQPLGREKTQGGRISSGCEVGFIIIC